MNRNIVYPDYDNSLVSLANSVLKKWGLPTSGSTLKLLDPYLAKDYKNLVVIILDGLGRSILTGNLPRSGFFHSHLVGTFSSTFPPTTVAAITSLDSGLTPCAHGLLGWDCYFPQIDRNVTVLLNTDTETGEKVAEESVARKYYGYTGVIERINEAGGRAYSVNPFEPPYPRTFEESLELVKKHCRETGRALVSCYCPEPDDTMHRTGCYSQDTKRVLAALEKQVAQLAAELEDTLLIITADHGQVDGKSVCIKDYPRIAECLLRVPTIEARALILFVKEDKRSLFEEEFNNEFGDQFLLLPKHKVLEMKLFGDGIEHKDFRSMLGDYLAVGVGNLAIFHSKEKAEKFKGVHAGLTADEMLIPLILVEKN